MLSMSNCIQYSLSETNRTVNVKYTIYMENHTQLNGNSKNKQYNAICQQYEEYFLNLHTVLFE